MKSIEIAEKLDQTKIMEKSELSRKLFKIGGAALLFGGIGYLWYRNSSLRAYLEVSPEKIYKTDFKIRNKLFVESFLAARSSFNKALIEHAEIFPNSPIKFMSPAFNEICRVSLELQRGLRYDRLRKEEILKSDCSELGVNLFLKKANALLNNNILARLKKREAINELEDMFRTPQSLMFSTSVGVPARGFQMMKSYGQDDKLDHKECLNLLLEYELDSLKRYIEFFSSLLHNGGFKDKQKIIQDFQKLFDERTRMEPLEAYARSHLGDEYGGELKYHPLILFLRTAVTPSPEAGYNKYEIDVLYLHVIIVPQAKIERLLNEGNEGPKDIVRFTKEYNNLIESRQIKAILRRVGIDFKIDFSVEKSNQGKSEMEVSA